MDQFGKGVDVHVVVGRMDCDLCPVICVQLLGRGQNAAFLQYVRTSQKRLAEVSKTLASHAQAHQSPSQ